MEPIDEEVKEVLLGNERNANIMRVGDTILDAAEEASIDENWCLLNNQSTYNAFINGKYLSNIRYSSDVKYLCLYYNAVVTYTNNIGDLPGYSNHVWYNPKGDNQHTITRIGTETPSSDLQHSRWELIFRSYPTTTNIQDYQGWSFLPRHEAPSQK